MREGFLGFEPMDGLPTGTLVEATRARPPESVRLVRAKLGGKPLTREDFDRILQDVVARRYSKPELAMFVLACALRNLDGQELVDFTKAMIGSGSTLHFDAPVVADKHCIGGIPGNRTTMVVVPILVSLGLIVPKTSSLAITSPAGTADQRGLLDWVASGETPPRHVFVTHGAPLASDLLRERIQGELGFATSVPEYQDVVDLG